MYEVTIYVSLLLAVLTTFTSSVLMITFLTNRNRLFLDPKPIRYPSISIAVPAYNKGKYIAKTVRYLLALDYPKKPEIIVINDGSSDNTREIVKSLPVKFIDKKKNGGKAKAVNDALRIAKGEIFGVVDAETFLKKDVLKNLIGYFNNKKVGAVIGSLKAYKPKSILERLQQIEYIFSILMRKSLTFLDCLYVTPSCSFYRKDLLRRFDGFDENKNLTEDLEIALRLHKAGYKIEHSVNADAFTVVPETFRALLSQRVRWYRGTLQNLVKHKDLLFEKSDFGFFLMPVILIGGLITTTLGGVLLLISAASFVYNSWVSLTGFWLADSISTKIALEPNTLAFLTSFALISLFISLHFSIKISRENYFKIVKDSVLYAIVYSPLLFVAWLITIWKEITRSERKW